ncbi:hypothetical protein M413DRAFT_26088 [Hebeloma cylindrosporum]|uniref:Uncharacterized protein n=1 Tax=Hebeloma cylindrosporum TaxID=76867 RepID=A0A0C2Y1R5_HEBCY|nr:hypothetical protein M413DRAFT_26088 [Hebeloma cylindrosporum h7]
MPEEVTRFSENQLPGVVNGDTFDDIRPSADVLEIGRNTDQGILIVLHNLKLHDNSNVLQSLHRWLEHVSEAGSDMLGF